MKKPSPWPEIGYRLPLDATDYEQIGRFIVAWNMLEGLIDMILFFGTDNTMVATEAILSSWNIAPRMDTFISVMEAQKGWVANFAPEAISIAKKVKELSNFRNEVAHGRWLPQPDIGAKAKKQIRAKTSVTMPEITAKHAQVCRLTRHGADLVWRMVQVLQYPNATASKLSPWHGTF